MPVFVGTGDTSSRIRSNRVGFASHSEYWLDDQAVLQEQPVHHCQPEGGLVPKCKRPLSSSIPGQQESGEEAGDCPEEGSRC